jgi:hypothetical protein
VELAVAAPLERVANDVVLEAVDRDGNRAVNQTDDGAM